MVVALVLLVGLTDVVVPREIWLGPAYLAVLALVAWTLGARVSMLIGFLIMAAKIGTGHFSGYSAEGGLIFWNVTIKVICISIVIGFMGVARRSCEKEWRFARTDPLTAALNRQAFFEIVQTDKCSGGWSALIFADLDGLKRLNDEQGHAQGDQSLVIFAETVRKTIRHGDVFARVGGDEFVIFMKIKDEAAASAVALRLHQALNSERAQNACSLQCSLGVLVLPHGSRSIDVELRLADQLMYMAKQSHAGVVVATALEVNGEFGCSLPVQIRDSLQDAPQVRHSGQEPSKSSVAA